MWYMSTSLTFKHFGEANEGLVIKYRPDLLLGQCFSFWHHWEWDAVLCLPPQTKTFMGFLPMVVCIEDQSLLTGETTYTRLRQDRCMALCLRCSPSKLLSRKVF